MARASDSSHAVLDAVLRRGRAWLVALVLLLAGLAAVGLVGQAERSPSETDTLPAGADSTAVVEDLAAFPEGDQSQAIVLFAKDEPLTPRDLRRAQRAFATVAPQADAAGAPRGDQPPSDSGDASDGGTAGAPGGDQPPTSTLAPSEDGTAAFGVVPIDAEGATQIAERVREIRDALDSATPPGVTAQVTGPAAIQADLAAVFEGADLRLLAATATVVAFLLIVTYRSPLLWLVPLTVVGIADQAAAVVATWTLAGVGIPWDESTVGILSVLVFGAGTDYSLLLISRYRDELKQTEDRYSAMRTALRRTVEPVVASSTTVVLGLLTLLLSAFPSTRGLGLACAVGVLVAMVAALVALPCTLVLFGRWIFWPRVPRTGQVTLVEAESFWRRVGTVVAAGPLRLIAATVLVLGAFAALVPQIDTGLSQADQFLEKPEAIEAAERLGESFPAGSADPVVVLSSEPAARVVPTLSQVPGVETVRPGPRVDGVQRYDAVLTDPPSSAAARQTVREIRAEVPEAALVGGTTAQDLDEASATSRDRWLLIPLILGLVTVALVLLLRSVVAPVILVLSVVATYFAALGISWLLFTQVLGFERLDVGVPLLAFLFLVGLGVDYNIFLVTRAGEEGRLHGPRAGMLRALAATGGVITSAGVLLAAVFAVLGVLPLVVLAQLGTVICVGVLLDTLVVRTVLVPAIAIAMGDTFWWPRRLAPEDQAGAGERLADQREPRVR